MPALKSKQAAGSELAEALSRCRNAFIGVGAFSGLINILMLTGPLFMLQVYDRVLPSHSVPTLIGFAILVAALFTFQGVLDTTRGRVLLRIAGSMTSWCGCLSRLAAGAKDCSRCGISTRSAATSRAPAQEPCSTCRGCLSISESVSSSTLSSALPRWPAR